MSENRKAIIIATGMDNIQLLATLKDSEIATGASLERIKGLYSKFSEQQAVLEARRNEQSLAKLKAFDDLKLAETERFFAAQRALYEENAAISAIGGGSVPENMAGAAGLAAAERAATGEVSHMATVTRELTVLMREGLRGNFTRMIGSATILIGAMGGLAARLMAMIPLIGIGTAAVLAPAYFAKKRAEDAADQSEQDVQDTAGRLGLSLVPKINALKDSGTITAQQATEWTERLRKGSYDDVNQVISDIRNAPKVAKDQKDELARLQREAMTPAQRQAQDLQKIHDLDMQSIKSGHYDNAVAVERAKAVLDYKKDTLDIEKGIQETQKQADEAKKKALDEQKERQKQIDDLERDRARAIQSLAADEQRENERFPTLAALARNGWQRVGRNMIGRTYVGQMAHDILFYDQDQVQQRLAGNIRQANWEANQEMHLKRTLGEMGYQPKDERWEALHKEIIDLHTKIGDAVKDGKMNVKIVDVSAD